MKITNEARTNRATLSLFTNALNRNGVTIPPLPAPAYEVPTLATRADVAAAALAAIEAGKDPATDKEVQRAVTSHAIAESGITKLIDLERSKAEIRHAMEQAPAIIEQLARQFTAAVEAMREAAPTIGHVDLSAGLHFTPGSGTTRVVAMAQAAEALNTATIIADTWGIFLDATGDGIGQAGQYGRLLYCKPTWQQYMTHRLNANTPTNDYGRAHNIWDMLNNGITVELATTATEYQQRVEHLEDGQAEAERLAERQERDSRPNYLTTR